MDFSFRFSTVGIFHVNVATSEGGGGRRTLDGKNLHFSDIKKCTGTNMDQYIRLFSTSRPKISSIKNKS